MLDEYPPGGGPPPSSSAGDDIPIGKGVNKNQMMDEYPPGVEPPKINDTPSIDKKKKELEQPTESDDKNQTLED